VTDAPEATAPNVTVTAPREAVGVRPPYFPVSATKLIVMSICTFGLYELQWFYMNWWHVRIATGKKIRPIWRTYFTVLFCYPLFRRIRASADAHEVSPRFSPGVMASVYIAIILLSGALEEPWPFVFVSHLPLAFIQNTVNEINARVAPGADRNDRYSVANRIAIALGGTITLLAALAMLSPP
jgi:hypothetical protein